MPLIIVLLAVIWIVLDVVFRYFYAQETRRAIIAGLIILVIVLWWFLGAPQLR